MHRPLQNSSIRHCIQLATTTGHHQAGHCHVGASHEHRAVSSPGRLWLCNDTMGLLSCSVQGRPGDNPPVAPKTGDGPSGGEGGGASGGLGGEGDGAGGGSAGGGCSRSIVPLQPMLFSLTAHTEGPVRDVARAVLPHITSTSVTRTHSRTHIQNQNYRLCSSAAFVTQRRQARTPTTAPAPRLAHRHAQTPLARSRMHETHLW